ncbi:ribosome maturation factor RimP [Campylobacter geochelonis]|uniref:ribosome maturation factor RimP n=1 Tax=Campylobacter geochelonis TaxID=1780362 RepID=UPI0007708AAA|nr:ribosome maturation factor RimP [Campylobacter geochelonis]CZE47247.1 ribosome maturation protein RimP [Campylobacter geochelonis]
MVDLKALLSECDVSLYDVETANENKRLIYRIYIVKPGGVTLEDCEKVSRLLSPIYDVEPPVNGDWILEVSSPGLERKLSNFEHFSNSIDELVKITLNDKNVVEGKLIACDDEHIEVQSGEEVAKINFTDIKKARTYIKW